MAQVNKDQVLFDRARAVIPGGVSSPVRAFGSVGGTPLFIAEATGPYVVDANGDTFVDLVCSWGPAPRPRAPRGRRGGPRGGRPRAVVRRADGGRGLLAEAIRARVPVAEQVRFVSTGTEATMTAVRLARGATGRDVIVKFSGCYHGHSDALLAAAGSGVATQGLPGSAGVTAAAAGDTVVVDYNDLAAVERVFDELGGRIAAVITEAAPANMGVVPPAPGFNAALRDITARSDALLILDEVLTGFRVGPGGWLGLEGGYEPDIVTFGKVVGGGMPLAALGGRAELMQLLAPWGLFTRRGRCRGTRSPPRRASRPSPGRRRRGLRARQPPVGGVAGRRRRGAAARVRAARHPERWQLVLGVLPRRRGDRLRGGQGPGPGRVRPVLPRHAARRRGAAAVGLRGLVPLGGARRAGHGARCLRLPRAARAAAHP